MDIKEIYLEGIQELLKYNVDFTDEDNEFFLKLLYVKLSNLEVQLLENILGNENKNLILETIVEIFLYLNLLDKTKNIYNMFYKECMDENIKEIFNKNMKTKKCFIDLLKSILETKEYLYSKIEKNISKDLVFNCMEQSIDYDIDEYNFISLFLVLEFIKIYFCFEEVVFKKELFFKKRKID